MGKNYVCKRTIQISSLATSGLILDSACVYNIHYHQMQQFRLKKKKKKKEKSKHQQQTLVWYSVYLFIQIMNAVYNR